MKFQVSTFIPTKWGNFKILLFSDKSDDDYPHFVLMHNECNIQEPVVVRIHSECLTGDLLGSRRCDCGDQLDHSMRMINEKKGILIYLRQEGRGIGIINKLKAYNLQDQGLNTVDANLHLGFEADVRKYNLAIEILEQMNIREIRLVTNNPDKIQAIENSSIVLKDRIPIVVKSKSENRDYLHAKKKILGHLLD